MKKVMATNLPWMSKMYSWESKKRPSLFFLILALVFVANNSVLAPRQQITAAPEPFYMDIVRAKAKKYQVDPNLIHAIILHESGGKVYALGSAGDYGLMQVLVSNMTSEESFFPFEPEANIEAGTRYLRRCLDRYKTLDKSISCYNMGINSKIFNEAYVNNVKLQLKELEK